MLYYCGSRCPCLPPFSSPSFSIDPPPHRGGGRLFALLPPTTVWFLAFLLDVSTWSHEWKSVPKEEEEEEPTAATAATLGEVEEYWIYIYIYIYIPSISTFNEWMGVWWAWRRGSRGDSGWLLLRGDSGIPSIVSYVPASVWLDLFDSGFLSRLRDAREGGGPFYFFYIHFFYLHIHPSIRLFVRPSVRYPSASGEKGSNWLIIFTHASSGCSTLRLPSIVFVSFHSIFIRFIPFHLDSGRVYVCVLRREMNGADMYMHPECFSTGLSHSNLLRSGFKQRFIVWSFLQFRLANICFGPFNSLWHHPIVEFLWNTINSERRKKNDLFISDWATMKHQPIKSSTGDNLISLGMKYDWITFTESHLLNRNQLMGDAVIETVTYAAMIYSERIYW